MSGAGSIDRILAILDLFTEARLEWSPEELMAELGYTRPTLYRYLKALRDSGLLTSHSGGGLTLGPRVVELDFLMRKSDRLVQLGTPILERLGALHPCSTLLVRWYGNKLLCVASASSSPNPRSSYPRGRPMPLSRGAMSRAILAHLPRRQRVQKIEENIDEMRALGLGETAEEIATALRRQARAGAIRAYGEVTPGVIGLAAPVFDAMRTPVAVLGMTLEREGLEASELDRLARAVEDGATELCETLLRAREEDPPMVLRA